MINIISRNYDSFVQSYPHIEKGFEKIKSCALHVFAQAAAAIAIQGIYLFTATAITVPPTVVLFTALTCAALAAAILTPALQNLLGKISRLGLVNLATLKINTYIHEYGHALAAYCCYVAPNPQVLVKGVEGATTITVSNGMTTFGRWLGEKNCKLLFAAGGPLSSVALAIVELTAAKRIGQKHPVAKDLLENHAYAQLAVTFLYAAKAFVLSPAQRSHDFVYLWHAGGIHPAVPLILIGSIVIFFTTDSASRVA